jgi:hypothetical protein
MLKPDDPGHGHLVLKGPQTTQNLADDAASVLLGLSWLEKMVLTDEME